MNCVHNLVVAELPEYQEYISYKSNGNSTISATATLDVLYKGSLLKTFSLHANFSPIETVKELKVLLEHINSNKDVKVMKDLPVGDMLETIFKYQKMFGSKFVDFDNLTEQEKEIWLQKFIMCCNSELNEILEWINWKHWKKPKYPINELEIKYEIIDLIHFVVSLCLVMGMGAKEVTQLYMNKNKENFDRQDRGY
jgi:hypothetical protein